MPGAAIALVYRDEIVWTQGFGFTERSNGERVTPDTLFSVQSMTKSYTAVGALHAVERGWLSLDDSVDRLIPGFAVRSRFGNQEIRKITLRHLLSHFAGLCHEAPRGGSYDDRPCTFAEHVASISDTWLAQSVGTAFGYSNLGADLAGYALQLRSGLPFERYMKDAVLDPLGMTTSTFDQTDVLARAGVARGYMGSFEVPRLPIPMLAAGGLYSNVREMSRFVSFQLSGGRIGSRNFVNPALLGEMRTPQFPARGQVGGYGLGLYNVPSFGAYSLLHQGGGYGYSSTHRWCPDYGVGVVVLCNQEYGNPAPGIAAQSLWFMIAELLGAVPPTKVLAPIRTPIIVPELAQLRRFEGRYRRAGGLVTVELQGDNIVLLDGDATDVLDAHTQIDFTNENRQYTFLVTNEDVVTGIHFLSPNFSTNASEYWEINDTPRDATGPDKVEWAQFIGHYSGHLTGNEMIVSVFAKNGFLYVDGPVDSRWHGGVKLAEYRPALFFTPEGESVEFTEGRMALGNRPFAKSEDDKRGEVHNARSGAPKNR